MMAELAEYLTRKQAVLAQRRADFTAAPGRSTVQVRASSWVAGSTGARPVKIGETTWITDSAPGLAGHALGPTAPEMLLGALASCLVHTYLIQAALLDLPLEQVEVAVEGKLDMSGVVGLPYTALPQLAEVTYRATVTCGASETAIEEMHAAVEATCPVLNTLRLPTVVTRVAMAEQGHDPSYGVDLPLIRTRAGSHPITSEQVQAAQAQMDEE